MKNIDKDNIFLVGDLVMLVTAPCLFLIYTCKYINEMIIIIMGMCLLYFSGIHVIRTVCSVQQSDHG